MTKIRLVAHLVAVLFATAAPALADDTGQWGDESL